MEDGDCVENKRTFSKPHDMDSFSGKKAAALQLPTSGFFCRLAYESFVNESFVQQRELLRYFLHNLLTSPRMESTRKKVFGKKNGVINHLLRVGREPRRNKQKETGRMRKVVLRHRSQTRVHTLGCSVHIKLILRKYSSDRWKKHSRIYSSPHNETKEVKKIATPSGDIPAGRLVLSSRWTHYTWLDEEWRHRKMTKLRESDTDGGFFRRGHIDFAGLPYCITFFHLASVIRTNEY